MDMINPKLKESATDTCTECGASVAQIVTDFEGQCSKRSGMKSQPSPLDGLAFFVQIRETPALAPP